MPKLDWLGESFDVQDEISAIAMGDFAVAAAGDDDKGSIATMAAMMGLLKDCVMPEDWQRFREVAVAKRAGFDALMEFVKDLITAQSERPTTQPSDFTDGLPATELKSVSSSADKVSQAFPGRPDKQLAVLRAQAAG